MYQDLNAIAQLKFGKEMDVIALKTQEKIRDASTSFAAMGSGIRSGHKDTLLGQLRIDGLIELARSLYQIWVDLIGRRNGHIGRDDIAFILGKVNEFLDAQKGHLNTMFAQLSGAVATRLTQQALQSLYALSATLHRDLEMMVREHEAFPNFSERKPEELSRKSDPAPNISIQGDNARVNISSTDQSNNDKG
jgi:hypothetical protein